MKKKLGIAFFVVTSFGLHASDGARGNFMNSRIRHRANSVILPMRTDDTCTSVNSSVPVKPEKLLDRKDYYCILAISLVAVTIGYGIPCLERWLSNGKS